MLNPKNGPSLPIHENISVPPWFYQSNRSSEGRSRKKISAKLPIELDVANYKGREEVTKTYYQGR